MNRRSMVGLVVVAGVAGVVAAAVAVVWLTRAPDSSRVPIGAVTVATGSGQRTVEVSLTYSSCTELDRVDVAEDTRTVRLTAYVHDLPSCGTAPTTTQVVPVHLGAPLGDRSVVDGSTGAPIPTG